MASPVTTENQPHENDSAAPTVPRVSANEPVVKLRAEARTLTSKESLSAYFTIAAAAFGLISDGCECGMTSHFGQSLQIHTCLDQNNLMTMANVSGVCE